MKMWLGKDTEEGPRVRRMKKRSKKMREPFICL
jgi:hypothetical protein